jgi:hypothetical protein
VGSAWRFPTAVNLGFIYLRRYLDRGVSRGQRGGSPRPLISDF